MESLVMYVYFICEVFKHNGTMVLQKDKITQFFLKSLQQDWGC